MKAKQQRLGEFPRLRQGLPLRTGISFVLFAAVLLFVASPLTSKPAAAGATFTVNSTDDAVDTNPGDGVCRTATGVCTLRAAVQESNALAGTDTIMIPAGIYALTIPGRLEDAAVTGDLDITGDVAITGAGAASTIIDGGALDRIFHVHAGTVNISDVTIRNGTSNGNGGGIDNHATLTLTNSMVTGNFLCEPRSEISFFCPPNGGGINNDGTITVINSTISDNNGMPTYPCPNPGGGLSNFGTALLINSTVSINRVEGYGGGISNHGTLTVTNSTISGNLARGGAGGGISNHTFNGLPGNIVVKSSVIANNTSPDTCCGQANHNNCFIEQGTLISNGHNLSNDSTCDPTGPGDRQSTNPVLGPLADNGGPTKTHALLSSSPGIDAGDNTTCPATDQRGILRPQGAACDIGAYEFVPGVPPPTYSIAGQMLRYKNGGGGNPIGNVTVCINASSGRCAPTVASGSYAFTGLPPGTYTITPKIDTPTGGYTFSPPSRIVNLSSNITGQDFTGFDRPPIVFVPGFQGFTPSTSCVGALPDDTFGRADNDLRAAGYYIEYAYLVSSWCNTPSLVDNTPRPRLAIAASTGATGQRKVIMYLLNKTGGGRSWYSGPM